MANKQPDGERVPDPQRHDESIAEEEVEARRRGHDPFAAPPVQPERGGLLSRIRSLFKGS